MNLFAGSIFESDLRTIDDALADVRGRVQRHREASEVEQDVPGRSAAIATDPQVLVRKAKAIYAGRRARDRVFAGLDLFADPAWDMLLDLFVAHAQDQLVSVSSLSIAASVPATTALRWIATLTSLGLIEREPDPFDHRRRYLCLTAKGVQIVSRAIDVS